MALIQDKQRVADEREELSQLPGLRRVVVAHHQPIVDAPAQTPQQVAITLRR